VSDTERSRTRGPASAGAAELAPGRSDTVVIDRRFCGPPDSANGGYTCGVLASYVGNPAEVTLRQPPPLERPLTVSLTVDGAQLLDGDLLVAEARAVASVDVDVPAPVSFADAHAAGARSYVLASPEEHPFPTCFVCGPHRAERDGLRVFVGPVEGVDGLYAAPWIPDASLVPADGAGVAAVPPEFVWAALDCSGGIAGLSTVERSAPYVLGRLSCEVVAPVAVGEECAVLGWQLGTSGRKLEVGSAVFRADGTLAGRARAVWIRLR
jgi:hypothetical protein